MHADPRPEMDTRESFIEYLRRSIAEWEAAIPAFRARGETELLMHIDELIAETKKIIDQLSAPPP